jgi:anaerobic nitric oxide reductase transcription regulator
LTPSSTDYKSEAIVEANMNEYQHLGLKEAVDRFQVQLIQSAYLDNEQNLSATAKQLQVNSGNLHRLMKRLNLK